MFGQGISREGDILDLAANTNVVNKVRCMVCIQRREDRTGPGKCKEIPERKSGNLSGD